MLHGIETLDILRTDIQKLEMFQKKMLKSFLSLPERVSDAAIYILLGAESIEQLIHKTIIGLFLRLIKDENSREYAIARRQLAIKDEKSNSWFVKVQHILDLYNLPSAYQIIIQNKQEWKRTTHTAIDAHWRNKWIEEAKQKTTLLNMNLTNWSFKRPHTIWCSVRDNPREIYKAIEQCKIMTGTYKTQSIQHRFDQTDPTCTLCNEDIEDYVHFLLKCKKLEDVRIPHRRKLIESIQELTNISGPIENDTLFSILVDCTKIVTNNCEKLLHLARDWIHAIHKERAKLIQLKL